MATVLIRDFDDALLETLKEVTGQKTGSKAVEYACERFLTLVDDSRQYREMIGDLEERNQVLRDRMESARAACSQVVEITGQGDFLDG